MKKKIERIKELFSKLPNWAQVIVVLILFVAAMFLWVIIWEFIRPFTIKWFLNPLGYIIIIIINAGIGLFSGYWLVKVTIAVLLGLSKKFGEIKIKEIPGLIGYFFIFLTWAFITFVFLGAAVNYILDPFGMSLQSLGILPYMYPGYFLDHPVYIFGYKVIPIFD